MYNGEDNGCILKGPREIIVMGYVSNQGSANDKFEGVTISHDMTIKEIRTM